MGLSSARIVPVGTGGDQAQRDTVGLGGRGAFESLFAPVYGGTSFDLTATDNAVAESFNSTLEFELLRDHHFTTREQARRAVAGWIDEYNTVRRHCTNHLLSPVDYERTHAQTRAGWQAA